MVNTNKSKLNQEATMTTQAELPTSDLILRVSGGSRDGELIPVGTPKCYLGMESTQEAISRNPHCVIFRGREGAVIRSYADKVMFNDSAASLHWLRKGDTIGFPNSMKVEVVQLGELKDKANLLASKESNGNSIQALAPVENLDGSRLVVLESELRSIQMQNEQSLTRFDQLESRLSTLTEKMTMLINLSGSGSGVEVSQTNEISAPPQVSGFVSKAADSSEDQNEEKIINPIENKSWVEKPQSDASDVAPESAQTESAQTEAVVTPVPSAESVQSSVSGQLPVEEAAVETQTNNQEIEQKELVNQITAEAPAKEVIQSPVSLSPLEELNRLDQAIDESVTDYYSHTSESDEQILTFDSDSTPGTESVTVGEATVTESPVTPTESDAPVSLTGATSTESTLDQETESTDAAAEAKAIADALAEKESRISEMERIFGGALSDSDTSQDNATSEPTQSDAASNPVQPTAPEVTESLATDSPTQPADEQLSQTFKDLTHSLNAEVDSSADNSLANEVGVEDQKDQLPTDVSNESDEQPKTESSTDDLEANLSPMALQLLQEVKADQAQELENTSVEPEATAEVAEPPVREEPETILVPEKEENESVSDLLARMKEDGKWDGVPDQDAPVEPVEPIQSTPEPEPMNSDLDASSEDGQGEDDVEDYMSQLLSRMRGEEPVVAAKAKKEEKKNKEAKKDVEEPKFEPPADPLTPDEFKPKQKAKKLESLDAMRELANSNARTNIKVSEVNNRKELAYVQAGIAVAGVLMSIYYFLWSSQSLGDVPSLIGVICLGAAAFCGYRYASTMKQSKSLASAAKPKKQAEPVEQAESV